jgi:hypothetical protein
MGWCADGMDTTRACTVGFAVMAMGRKRDGGFGNISLIPGLASIFALAVVYALHHPSIVIGGSTLGMSSVRDPSRSENCHNTSVSTRR